MYSTVTTRFLPLKVLFKNDHPNSTIPVKLGWTSDRINSYDFVKVAIRDDIKGIVFASYEIVTRNYQLSSHLL